MQLNRDPRHPAGTSRSLVDGPDRAAQLLSSRAWHDGNVYGLAHTQYPLADTPGTRHIVAAR